MYYLWRRKFQLLKNVFEYSDAGCLTGQPLPDIIPNLKYL